MSDVVVGVCGAGVEENDTASHPPLRLMRTNASMGAGVPGAVPSRDATPGLPLPQVGKRQSHPSVGSYTARVAVPLQSQSPNNATP